MIQKIVNFILNFFCTKIKEKVEVFLGYEHSQEELELLSLINNHRANLKLKELYINSYLSYKCEKHSLRMIKDSKASHNGFVNRSEDIIKYLKCEKVAENIAYNYISSKSVLNVWLLSEGHKENI